MFKSFGKVALGLVVPVVMGSLSHAQVNQATELAVVQNYADHVSQSYNDTLAAAVQMQELVKTFVAAPTDENLAALKLQWTEARKLYSRTEVFRFYAGPIDNETGPEGAINAWPLDEAYIDGVMGADKSGIINNLTEFPVIDGALLRSLNEKDGEKNIATGWHAIEFLLWGQDFSEEGPGKRAVTDYIVGKGKNSDRRAVYLTVATELLIEDLTTLTKAWDQATPDSYYNTFVAPGNVKQSLGYIMTGTVRLAGFELSQERMFVAYDTQLQEDEHSCFSDTTHNDLVYNFLGIKDVILGETMGADTIIALLENANPAAAVEIKAALADTEAKMRAIPAPFDQAIFSEDVGRPAILAGVQALENLAVKLEAASKDLGVELVPAE